MAKKIILASNSPRRQELLRGLDVEFTVDTGNSFVEEYGPDVPKRDIPALMSVGKSHGFHRPLADGEVLITADTMVLQDNVIMGKPHSREAAVDMLRMLSGHTHEVITAVTIRDREREVTFSDSTLVTFKELDDAEIAYYIDNYRPFDKAGAYGIQEWIGYVGISGISGSFYNVMGFPVHRVAAELRAFMD